MARKKGSGKGLGRGLDALFADAAPILEEDLQDSGNSYYLTEDDIPGYQRMRDSGEDNEVSGTDAAALKGKEAPERKRKVKEASPAVSGEDTANAGRKSNKKEKESSPSAEADGGDEDRIIYIDINDIRPNSAQPRQNFSEEKLKELAESIRANGVIQPVIVRKKEQGYELVAGERRWRASRIAGLRHIPAIQRNFDDRQNAIVAIIENMQREDLNPIEEARGLKSMSDVYGFTQEQISASLGRSRTYIANSIRLLKLPEDIQEYVSSGKMSAAHGRTIINIPDPQKQKALAEKIIRNDMSVRATERLAEKIKDELRPERKKRKRSNTEEDSLKSADIQAAERELMTLTGTRVNITGESSGRLELEFYSTAELNRIIDILREAFGRETSL